MDRFDADRAARHAPAQLTPFEDVHQLAMSLDMLRSKFSTDVQELMRARYAPRPSRLAPHDSKYHAPSQIETPVIRENVAANQLMFLLFEQRTNLKGIVCEHYRANSDTFDIRVDFGIDIDPFLNKVSTGESKQIIAEILPPNFDPTNNEAFRSFIDASIHSIHSQGLTGNHRFLSKAAIDRRNILEYRNACRNYIRVLAKRYIECDKPGSETSALAEMQSLLLKLLYAYRINELASEACRAMGYDEVLATFGDELAELSGAPIDPIEGDSDFDFRYAPRTFDYVDLGTRYGDCTSRNKEKQVNQVPNIFWTIASHVLDVFYQVQELHYRQQPLLKMHLVPCFVRDEPTLNVDAIETTARMRREDMSDLPLPREELLAVALQRVIDLADAMGIEHVTCEPYSNTDWVRTQLSRLPSRTYNVREYRSLYDDEFVAHLAESLLDVPIEIRSEIQALNLRLMDQGLREGYREQKVLRGSGLGSSGALRGV